MRDDALLTLVTDPSVDVGSWAIAEVEVDPVSVIVPASDEALSGVFAVVLAEIKRTPLVEWIDRHATQGTPGEQDAAMALQLFLDVSRNP